MAEASNEKMICMKAKCISIVVLICQITVICCTSSTDLGWDRSVETIPPSYYSVSTTNVLRCGKLCERQGKCASVTFDVRERKCYMHDTSVTNDTEKASIGRYLNKNYPKESKPENTCDEATQISVPTLHQKDGACYNIIEINECDAAPCKNNGTCEDRVNDYFCSCTGGFTGKNCSDEINECDASPCKNNGTCEDRVNDYFCRCTGGFTGKNCSDEINCPESIGFTYVQHLNLCYLMNGNVSKTIKEAELVCALLGAHLITINNSEVQSFLRNEILDRALDTLRFFIGGSDEEIEGVWKTSSGDIMTYTYWSSGQPNGGMNENCLAMAKGYDYHWADVVCEGEDRTGGYICQIDIT